MTRTLAGALAVWAAVVAVRVSAQPAPSAPSTGRPAVADAAALEASADAQPAQEPAPAADPSGEPPPAGAPGGEAPKGESSVTMEEEGFDLAGPGFDMQPVAPRPRYDQEVPEESSPVRGWLRFDVDRQGPRIWVGAVHSLGGLDLASDIYFNGPYAVLDVGVVLGFGPVSFLPMAGIGFNFAEGEAANIIGPQLFTIIDTDPIYFESWIQMYFNEVFGTYAGRLRGPGNQFYTRNFLLYNVSSHFAVGPQMELAYDFSAGGWLSLPVGGGVNVHYGDHNTLALYLGYDTQAGDDDRLAGRFTFIRTW
jgi:hypothetical protein